MQVYTKIERVKQLDNAFCTDTDDNFRFVDNFICIQTAQVQLPTNDLQNSQM